MTTGLLAVLAIVVPGILAAGIFARGAPGALARAIAPWAALPPLVMAVLPITYPAIDLGWVLLGTRLELDPIGRLFLILFSLLWTVSGVYARSYLPEAEHRRFFPLFLLTMAGNVGLPLAGDAASFYLFFAVMTFSAYGLVIHRGDGEALRAGRVYIVLAVIGEAFILTGLLFATSAAGTLMLADIPGRLGSSASTVTMCLLVGFGIKAGAVPLHVWLPLAHPVAPTPASAVLSGSMIKAGLLGWIRFFPLGEQPLEGWGAIVVAMGALAAFFGVVIGIVQTDPKTVLAYSSISQMGVINIGVGIGLAAPDAALPAIAAVTVYALHHGLAKGALFLGVGVAESQPGDSRWRSLFGLGLLLPALAIAGAPLTSGAVAKGGLKALLPLAPLEWHAWTAWLLPLSALATTLLMARFLYVTFRAPEPPERHPLTRGVWVPWAVLLAFVAGGVRLVPHLGYLALDDRASYGGGILLDILPIAVGGLFFWLVGARGGRMGRADPLIAPGDLLNPLEAWFRSVPRVDTSGEPRRDPVLVFTSRWYDLYAGSRREDLLLRLELRITRWAPAILLTMLLMAGLLALISLSR
jgi:formate hydrogenlyase subunit 3/multisubunit Na+/H+ antiporter MnhD subunit